jgi:hypothetical protein
MNVKTVIPLSKVKGYSSIRKKLEEKKHSLQFLPISLEAISKNKKFMYKNKLLKTSYIIDISHNLILKYYFKKENKFNLMSTILKEKYGHLYNYYIDFLVENEILILLTNYMAGKNARIYKINDTVLKGEIKRFINTDRILLKKYKNKVSQIEEVDIEKSIINQDVKTKLVNDLFHTQIQFDKSIFYLDNLKDEDNDIYNRNRYSVECINDKHIFYHFDSYGRMHTNFTILKSFIRKNCLLIEGDETYERDLNNSQLLFLTKIIIDSNSKWVKENEFQLFKYLTINGKYYQYVMDYLKVHNKNLVKEMTYKVLFGRNINNSKADKVFKELFPTIYNFIKLYKKERGDYKVLAYELQRAESNFIFNKVVKEFMYYYPDVKLVTVHDSIICKKIYRELLNNIFDSKIKEEFNYLF